MIPAIAPDAPTSGTVLPGWTAMWARVATIPAST
jgi:hypothetical protein